jgi:hypothetical protein
MISSVLSNQRLKLRRGNLKDWIHFLGREKKEKENYLKVQITFITNN